MREDPSILLEHQKLRLRLLGLLVHIEALLPSAFQALLTYFHSWDQNKEYPKPIHETKEQPLFLVLDQLNDVRNFGAIIRTAECAGVDGIVIQKKGSAPINGDSIKTSAGAVFNIPISKVDHIKDALYYFQASDIKTIAATEKTKNTLYDTNFKEGCAIVMGSEGKGISDSVLKIVDVKAKLPMFGKIASLNVSVACGAFLYEAVRQRHSSTLKV